MQIKPLPDPFNKLGNKAYLLALGLILLIICIVFKDYFFEKYYCFKDFGSDSYNQYYPFEYLTTDYIAKHGIPKWSFSMGMGQNIFQFVLRDPFDILFYYIPGKNFILDGKLYKELAKILLGGLLFFFYLKTLKLSDFTSIIGSLLFSFCGFMIVAGVWYMFSFEAFNMALLLLAFELLFTKGKWYWFPVAIFLIGISNPVCLYLYGLFIAVYAVFRHLQTGPFNFKKLSSLVLTMAGLGLIGVLLSGPFLILNTLGVFESPRGIGGFSHVNNLASSPIFNLVDNYQFGVCVMRFFSSDMLGTQASFKVTNWWNFLEMPEFYCGLPCLLLMPQVFQFLTGRVKIAFIFFLTAWLLPIFFPYLRQAFWLFSDNFYRTYAFFVVIIFLYYSLQALEFIIRKKKIDRVVLVITFFVLLLLLNYPFFSFAPNTINTPVYFFTVAMLILYGLLLFFIPTVKNPAYFKWIFIIAVVVELTYLSGVSVNGRDAFTRDEVAQKINYNDYSVDAAAFIKQHDHSFYRIDKNYRSSPVFWSALNDGMIQGYYGTTCFSSFNQEYYAKYLNSMGIVDKTDEFDTRWSKGLYPYYLYESENSVKYIFTHGTVAPFARNFYDSIAHIGNVTLFRNKEYLPLGYAFTHYIKESDFDQLPFKQKYDVSIKTCIVPDDDMNKITGLSEYAIPLVQTTWQQDVNSLRRDTLAVTHFDENFITGTVNSEENEMMYLSIPYDQGWTIKVDGQPTNKIILNGGMTGVMLKAGSHTIELKYELPFFNLGLLMSLIGLLAYFGYWLYARRKPITY